MTSVVEAERDKYTLINFEETELRFGLPGGSANGTAESAGLKNACSAGKRGFSESDTTVDLKLNLSSSNELGSVAATDKKTATNTITAARANDPAKPPAANK